MKLQRQVITAVGGALAVTMAGLFIAGAAVVVKGYRDIEREAIRDDLTRSSEGFRHLRTDLAAKLEAWSNWTDCHRFVTTRDPAFVESQLRVEALDLLDIDAIVILDHAGRPVVSLADGSARAPLPEAMPGLSAMITQRHHLLSHQDSGGIKHALVSLPEGLFIIASGPIHDDHVEGPPIGTVAFASQVDGAFVASLASHLRSELEILRMDGADLPAADQIAVKELVASGGGWSFSASGTQVVGRTLLHDADGRPAALLRQLSSREVYQHAQRTLAYFFGALILAALASIAATLYAVKRLVVRRVERMHGEIRRIRAGGDVAARVTVEGPDELAQLAGEINSLLSTSNAAQRHVAESEQRFRDMADCSPMLIWLTEPDKRTSYVNRGWAEFTGVPIHKHLGHGWTESVHPEDRDAALDRFNCAYDTRQPYQNEYRLRRHDGEYRWVLSRGVPFTSTDGEFRGYIGSCIDITERRQLEHDMRSAQESAASANRAKSAFLASMSHEIRTPMTAITGYADLLAAEQDPPLPPERRAEAVDAIRRNGEHLLALINDVLDMSKIEAGRMTVERVPCSVQSILKDVEALLRVRADLLNVDFTINIRYPLPAEVLCDPLRLRQVLVNIVGNAIKFSPGGSVALRAAFEPAPASGERSVLRFDVFDTGIGMTDEQVTSIFSEFSQADRTVTRKFGGTGLGLSISRNLARLLGGDITVSSVPGKGSTFTVIIAADRVAGTPMLDADSPEPTPAPAAMNSPAAAPRPAIGRVLLAEDSADNQRLLCFHLERAGYRVDVAENGLVAVEKCLKALSEAHPFDLILMDMQMPEMDGFEATRALRASGIRTPIAALTAHALSEDRQRCLEAGCDEHIPKPIDQRRLIEACARLICSPRSPATIAG